MVDSKQLAKKLKSFRKERKLSQTELGELIGLQQKDISYIETCTGNSIDSIQKVCLYADACNIPYNLIFENEINTELSGFGYKNEINNPLEYNHQAIGDDHINMQKTEENTSERRRIHTPQKEEYVENGGLILSKNIRRPMYGQRDMTEDDVSCNNNIMVLEGVGTLKASYISTNLTSAYGTYIIVTDKTLKNEIKELKNNKYKVVVIDMDHKNGNYEHINELEYKIENNNNQYMIEYEIDKYTQMIIGDSDENLYFDRYKKFIFAKIVEVYLKQKNTEEINTSFREYLLNIVNNNEKYNEVIQILNKCTTSASIETIEYILKNIIMQIKSHSKMRMTGNCRNMKTLKDIIQRPKTALIIKRPVTTEYNVDVNCKIIIEELLNLAMERDKKECVRFIFDNFGDMPQINNFVDIVSDNNHNNISISILLQSLYQINTIYKDESIKLKNNIKTIICSNIISKEDAGYISDICGTDLIISKSRSIIYDEPHISKRKLITRAEVERMKCDKCLVIRGDKVYYDENI